MNPATNNTITAPTIRYVLLEPPDPLLRLVLLLFAKMFLFLVRGEIVAHAARFSETFQYDHDRGESPRMPQGTQGSLYAFRTAPSVETRGEAEGLEGSVMVAHVVDLESGMGDAVLVGDELFEFAPAGVAVFVLTDEDVGGEGWEA
jgi:hypothetical protein